MAPIKRESREVALHRGAVATNLSTLLSSSSSSSSFKCAAKTFINPVSFLSCQSFSLV